MLKTRNILATAAMTVLMALAGSAEAGHGGSFGGGGGFHPQMPTSNMGLRQVGSFQSQRAVASSGQMNALKLQVNHSNGPSNLNRLPNVANSKIQLANNLNHGNLDQNKFNNALANKANNIGHHLPLHPISNNGMNGQSNSGNFKPNPIKPICPPWSGGSGKYTGCWGNYGGCYGNYGGCFGNYGGWCGYPGYGCGTVYPYTYANWGYGCGDWGYTCGYYPRYYTCYSYPIVQPCPVVSCAYAPATQVVSAIPVTSGVVTTEVTNPTGNLALSDVAVPPSPVQ